MSILHETEFNGIIQDLRRRGKANGGYVTYEELNQLYPSHIAEAIQSDKYLKILDALGVHVIREEDVKKFLEVANTKKPDKEAPTSDGDADMLQMHLHQMSGANPLTRDEEFECFERIEKSKERSFELFNRFLFAPVMYCSLLDKLENCTERFSRVVALRQGSRRTRSQREVYLKNIPIFRKRLQRIEDKMRNACEEARFAASLSKDSVVRLTEAFQSVSSARSAMSKCAKSLRFKHRVVETFCAEADERIYLPYRALLAEQARLIALQPSRKSVCDLENVRGRLAKLEALFGMSGKEFVATFSELREVLKNGQIARTKIIESNLRFVISVVKKYMNKGLSFLDLIQEGTTGLVLAIEKFDYKRGNRFITYAKYWVRKAAASAVLEQGRRVRLPIHMYETVNKFRVVQKRLGEKLGREPKLLEIAAKMELPLDQAQAVSRLSSYQVPFVVDERATDGEGYSDFIPLGFNLTGSQKDDDYTPLRNLLRAIIRGPTLTIEEVGLRFGVSRERIRQIEARALKKLRQGRLKRLDENRYLSAPEPSTAMHKASNWSDLQTITKVASLPENVSAPLTLFLPNRNGKLALNRWSEVFSILCKYIGANCEEKLVKAARERVLIWSSLRPEHDYSAIRCASGASVYVDVPIEDCELIRRIEQLARVCELERAYIVFAKQRAARKIYLSICQGLLV